MTHLYALSASGWSLWRWACVRGAGFPIDRVLTLASRDTVNAIDRLLDLEGELRATTAQAISAVDLESQTERTERSERRAIATHLRRLKAGGVPDSMRGLSSESCVAIERLRAASLAWQEARAAAEKTLAAEQPRLVQSLREACRDPRFREALVWQNRHALETGVDALLRQPDTASNRMARRHERLVASYLQRYCVKNDTIGFFGPVGWSAIEGDLATVVVRPGPSLLTRRTVYFEHWCIDALATSIAEDPLLRRHLAPRRHPTAWIEGTTLHHAIDKTTELPLEFARLLAACDGQRSASEIAQELVDDPELDLSSEDEVYELLEELTSKRIAIWTLEIPPHVEHPDRVLGMLLDAVKDRDAAAPGVAKLAELQEARDDVARAAGDAAALDRAFSRLEDTFTRQTGSAATRRTGETYAGRSLVYEDCVRDLEMTIGPALIERFGVPLSLLLMSARWFTFTLARRYRETFTALHRDLQIETGSSSIDFLRFWERASEHFSGHAPNPAPIVAETAQELQRRWAQLVGLEGAAFARRNLDAMAEQVASQAAAMFAAPCPGWPSARHHSPDLMIAASSVDAITRGDFVVVVGELHVSAAKIAMPVAVHQHRCPSEIVTAMEHDRPASVVEAVVPKERATRANRISIHTGDLDLEFGVARSWRHRGHVLEAGSLVVEPAGSSLCVRTRDGAHSFALEEFLDSFLSQESAVHFKLVPSVPHCPRVSIDGFVVHRESWRFEAAELEFARAEEPIDRMLAIQRWARTHQLPRFLFYKIPEETKPCYLDLESPHYVELFAHLVRKASVLHVSEMLPAVDQLWLPDSEGARYTCELRVVAVDPEPWRSVL
jgi:hypothetical protein